MHFTEWILMAFDFGNLLGCSVMSHSWLTVKWCSSTLHLGSDKKQNMFKHFFEINAGFTIFLKNT